MYFLNKLGGWGVGWGGGTNFDEDWSERQIITLTNLTDGHSPSKPRAVNHDG